MPTITRDTLVQVLRRHAGERPDAVAYSLIDEGGAPSTQLSYAELDLAARAFAARLQQAGRATGERVLIMQPTGIQFLHALFGALYAGAAAMPVAVPRSTTALPALSAILQNGAPRFGSLTDETAAALAAAGLRVPERDACDDVPEQAQALLAQQWRMPDIDSQSLALVQYTSGSTALPRGAMASHGNICHNSLIMSQAFQTTPESVFVCWLPLFHDMGLIGNVLHSAWLGAHCALMSPSAFIRRPVRWLEAITRTGADFAGAPNFAYELCARKVSDEDCARLNLSHWRVAYSGAEPVRDETLVRFSRRFASSGFRSRSFYPCYGLAEATVFVSGGDAQAEPRRFSVSAAALARDVAEPAAAGEPARTFVSCGRSWCGQKIRIVDWTAGRVLPERRVGEIWVAGDSVTGGYFGNPEGSAEIFGGRLRGEDGEFLRTGDLGFLDGGELFITGRRKDLIIVHGRNLYPQDIEHTIESSHALLRPGCAVCFAMEYAQEERLVAVIDARVSQAEWDGVVGAVRAAVMEQHDVPVFRIVLGGPGAIEKTSSGKPRRRACRDRLERGELPIRLDSEMIAAEPGVASPAQGGAEDAGGAEGPDGADGAVLAQLRRLVAEELRLPLDAVGSTRALIGLGLDSLSATSLRLRLKEELGVSVPLATLFSASPAALAALACDSAIRAERPASTFVPDPVAPANPMRAVSALQRQIWLYELLAPGRHHIAFGLEIDGSLSTAACRRALSRLIERHEAFRMAFSEEGGQLSARVDPRVTWQLLEDDLQTLDHSAQQEWVRTRARADAGQAFDLTTAPLARFRLVTLSTRRRLLILVLHHLIADGWSVGVIVRDLARFCAQPDGDGAAEPTSGVLTDIPSDATEAERSRAYWSERLAGAQWSIDLPRTRPRRGAASTLPPVRFSQSLAAPIRRAVEELALSEGVTPFVVMLAAFECLLHHYSGQNDLVVGTVVARRESPATREIVGPLVNTVALRADCSGDPEFRQLVHRLRAVVTGALEHAALSFDEVTRAADAGAHGTALLGAMFVYQSAVPSSGDCGDVEWRVVDLDVPSVPFDLTLEVRQTGDSFVVAIDADGQQFDENAARGILTHYLQVLAAALADCRRNISGLSAWPATVEGIAAGPQELLEAFVPVHEAFSASARQAPLAPAILGESNWSYEQIESAANHIAGLVRAAAVEREGIVGIHIANPALRWAAVLGVLKAGAAYLPLDTALPEARLSRMFEISRAALVLSASPVTWCPANRVQLLPSSLEGLCGVHRFEVSSVHPEQLAYVVFTSGSTGDPLAVGVRHAALAQHCCATASAFGLTASDRVLQFASFAFDVAAEETFPTWSRGGAVVTVEDRSPAAVHRLIAQHGVTVLNLPSRYWELWSAACDELPHVRTLILGSEIVSAAAVSAFRQRFPGIQCLHAYGLAETAITSTVHAISTCEGERNIALGAPLAGTRVYVLDHRMQPVGPGGSGEIWIGGCGLARGYIGRAGRTAQRFMPNPFARTGERLLRTGDRARRRWDGEIEFLGRMDSQLKLRGHRVAPEEIEATLRRSGAREVAVVARDEQLLAYVECGERSLAELCRAATTELPRYMVPAQWIEMHDWPRSASGKVDRLRLPDVPKETPAGSAPQGPLEERLATIFREVLGLDAVSRETDFFVAGGHSLLAMRMIDLIERAWAVKLPLSAVFEAPTLRELGARIGSMKDTRGSSVTVIDLPRDEAPDTSLPLSAPQRRLWFLEMLHGRSAQYNMPLAIVVRGPLDAQRLTRAFDALIERHEQLRVRFDRGSAWPGPRVKLEVRDVASTAEAERRALELARAAFAPEQGPLIAAEILRVSPAEHMVVIVVHHLVCDGRSLQIMLAELGEHYRTGRLEAVAAQPYGDYVREEATRDHSEGLSYWRKQLFGSAPTWLPYDGPENNFEAGRVMGELPVTAKEIATVSRRAGVTTHMTLVGLVQVLLHRIGGDEDIRIAIPVANRKGEQQQNTIGCFVNTVILRNRVDRDTPFLEHLKQVKRAALEAYEHQATPFDDVVTAVRIGRGPGIPPIEVMLLVEEDNLEVNLGEGFASEVRQLDSGAAKFDITITIRVRKRALEAEIEYDTGRFARRTVCDLLSCLQEISQSIVRAPEDRAAVLRMMSAEQELEIAAWERGPGPVSARMLHELVLEQAERTPDAVAVLCGARRLTYRQLAARANQVARGLLARGMRPEALVGLRMSRTEDLIAAMLGVLQAGGTYVPIDPEYPEERQRYIERDSGAQFSLGGIGEFLRESGPVVRCESQPSRLAYVIYTSGSEGRPKGVAITHAGASALIEWAQSAYSPAELRQTVACTSVCFDLSAFEIYAPLSVGGTVILVENALAIPDADGATLVNTVPSAMARVIERLPKSVLTVNLAGEALPRSLVEALYDRGVQNVWNLYGPSEDTTYSTGMRIARGERQLPGIGRPLPGRVARLLDDEMERVPACARGEVYLGGAGLGRGYLHQADRSALRFGPDAFAADGSRLYRTGDWARYRADGTLEFLGRRDAQVKVRGYRVEPAEVEDGLRRAGAAEAVVAATTERLIAYVECGDRDLTAIRASVQETLPRYLVPSLWVKIEAWPRTASGKIDRKALPAPEESGMATSAPAGEDEEQLAQIYREVLGVQQVGRETSFFEAGGHSLLAMQAIERIDRAFGLQLPVRQIFESPVLWQLAARIAEYRATLAARAARSQESDDAAVSRIDRTRAPTTAAQRRLWFLDRLSPGTSMHHVPVRLEVVGPLNVTALTRAFEALVARHESLRTTFVADEGVPLQRIAPAIPLPIDVLTIENAAEVESLVTREVEKPFDLAAGPLFRISVILRGAETATLLLIFHHIVCDEWSLGVLLREFSEHYLAYCSGSIPALPPLQRQLAEHAAWEASVEGQAQWEDDRRYWSQRLRGLRPLMLPRPDAMDGSRGEQARYRSFVIERAVCACVRDLALRSNCTHAMVLMAAFTAILHRDLGTTDIAVGMPVANRRADTEPLIGFFVNQLVIRIDLDGNPSFDELLRRVRAAALDAYSHQQLPFDEVVAVAGFRGARPAMPLVNVQLDVHNAPFGSLQVGPLTLTPATVSRTTAQFDLQLSIEETKDGMSCFLGFNADHVDATWVERLADDLVSILSRAAMAPEHGLRELSARSPAKQAATAEDFCFR